MFIEVKEISEIESTSSLSDARLSLETSMSLGRRDKGVTSIPPPPLKNTFTRTRLARQISFVYY